VTEMKTGRGAGSNSVQGPEKHMVIGFLRRLASDEGGSEIVEFAFSICVWMAGAFLVMYGSFALYAAHFVANAADEAARFAIVRGSSWNGASCSSNSLDCTASSTDIQNYVVKMLPPGLSPSKLTVSTSWPGTTSTGTTCDSEDGDNSPNCVVQVRIGYSFSFPLPFLPKSTLPLSSSSSMTISQ
jgi:Flp pilus assembly protein TadG